jgi:hypothetical protein
MGGGALLQYRLRSTASTSASNTRLHILPSLPAADSTLATPAVAEAAEPSALTQQRVQRCDGNPGQLPSRCCLSDGLCDSGRGITAEKGVLGVPAGFELFAGRGVDGVDEDSALGDCL